MEAFASGKIGTAVLAKYGQAISEYWLIGTLVLVVSIGAISVLSGSVNGLFDLFGDSTAQGKPLTPGGNSPGAGGDDAIPVASVPPMDTRGVEGLKTVTVTLANGKTVTLTGYPADIAKTVETAGANGATQLLAQQLETLAKQLAEAGEITPEQASALYKLANQGHRIGQVEGLVSKMLKSSGTMDEFVNQSVMFDGKPLTGLETLNILGWDNSGGGGTIDPLNPLASSSVEDVGPETAAFLELYQAAVASGAMTDPAVAALVKTMSHQISDMSDSVEAVVAYARTGGIPKEEIDMNILERVTHRNSAVICGSGQGSDTGVHCSG